MPTRILILGAAGRDFHNFNVAYRDDPDVHVVAFTQAQIPRLSDRRYPASLAGPRYPAGIPIENEADLEAICRREAVDRVVFAYSDVPHAAVMHLASRALAVGADFALLENTVGFGYRHDGAIDSLARFVSRSSFPVASDQEVADLVAFLPNLFYLGTIALVTWIAAIALRFLAGQSVTLYGSGGGVDAQAVYPVASCPCDDRNLHFHVGRDDGDAFAQMLFDGGCHGVQALLRSELGENRRSNMSRHPAHPSRCRSRAGVSANRECVSFNSVSSPIDLNSTATSDWRSGELSHAQVKTSRLSVTTSR